jgi:hypothetical protein
MPYPLDCPFGDWPNDPSGLPASEQVAGLLDHIEEVHGEPIPEPVREALKACRKELEKLPV